MSLAEESAGGDVEFPTPFTDEQVKFLGLLVERLVSRALESRENTDTLPSTDLAGADRIKRFLRQGSHGSQTACFITDSGYLKVVLLPGPLVPLSSFWYTNASTLLILEP